MATPPPAGPLDPLAALASLYTSPFLVRLGSLPRGSGWRLELSEDDGTTWTSLEAGKVGHATPAEAIEAGANLIAAWKLARVDASSAEIAFFFENGKLERRKVRVPDPNNSTNMIEVDGYAALSEDDLWIESLSPIEAINKAKEKDKEPKAKNSGAK